MNFSDFSLHPKLLRAVEQMGYTQPTPIQTQAIPPALAERDVLACAMTGSGKTAAFVLPILQRLLEGPRGVTRALVLAPTRELAAQVQEQFEQLGKGTGIRSAAVFGGVGMEPQTRAFRSGVEVIVATPGRLLDHFQHPYARLEGLEVLVLDEADRMLDMGFLPDIRRVLRHIPKPKQTLFFSATMPEPIAELAKELLSNPVTINTERKAAPAKGITQAVYPVPQELKPALLLALLDRQLGNVIVFTRTKHRANRLAEFLEKNGVNAARIHGNRSQSQRTEALAGFKSGKYRVLVATDIAARGIDVEALEHVVNFDVPAVPEDYIHRVGRTARAERTGEAFTFVAPDEEAQLRDIEKAIGRKLERVMLERFDYSARPQHKLEVPIQERIAAMRAQRAQARANKAAKEQRAAEAKAQQDQAPKPQRARPAKARANPTAEAGSSDRSTDPKKRRRRRRKPKTQP
ncbi:ATP-dependent RNA helicase RhlE [Calidithermus terrae]|uniref:RNA helicase n=1 Tax=Calidithermus terrae TaxID=1408545 RepID=A0A399EN86_9DEIN|nr:DEAD/DEAH box helicase [Calidithermus terrae]RIH86164.1 ATP-dependent RNA helicase RhlE [Calidithermus terrae]